MNLIKVEGLCGFVLSKIKSEEFCLISNINLHFLRLLFNDSSLLEYLRLSHKVLLDGYFARFFLRKKAGVPKTSLTQLVPMVFSALRGSRVNVLLLGASKKSNTIAVKKVTEMLGKNASVEGLHGYCEDDKNYLDALDKSRPNLVLLCFGMPKQERFVLDNVQFLRKFNAVFLPCGAVIDRLSQSDTAFTKYTSLFKIEWLFRVFKEPKRLFLRYLKDGAFFVKFLWSQ